MNYTWDLIDISGKAVQCPRGAGARGADHRYLPSHPAGSWVGKGTDRWNGMRPNTNKHHKPPGGPRLSQQHGGKVAQLPMGTHLAW